MNAIIFSAGLGIVMMFTGLISHSKTVVRYTAIGSLVLLFIVNILDMGGNHFFTVDVHNMLYFETFGLLFNAIAFGATLIYFLLSSKDILKVGINGAEYFALIFFILCGVGIVTSFNTLLMLFLGIEIISI